MKRLLPKPMHAPPWPKRAYSISTTMLDDIREQRDRWQQQAERVAALAITDQRKESAPAQPQSWWRRLRA